MYRHLVALLLSVLLLSGCSFSRPPAATAGPSDPPTETTVNLQEVYDRGYAQGRSDGAEEGRKAGYQTGYQSGYESGYSEGFAAGTVPTEAPSETTAPVSPAEEAGFVSVSDYIPDVILEIRYYSTYNFVGQRIRGYEDPVALLTREAAEALRAVSDDLRLQGYRLKIYDAYRPQQAVDHFAAWALDLEDADMKPYFYPEVAKEDLFDAGYIAYRSGHSRGSTVDLTLFEMETGKEADMGGTFDWFGQRSHSDYTDLTDRQLENRRILYDAMTAHGFYGITSEWWHFTLEDEPYPDTYFDFPVAGW